MIKVRDIILLVKSRLRTEDPKKADFDKILSDAELVSYVNMAYLTIASQLHLFKNSLKFELNGSKIYPFPHDILTPLAVFINGRQIPIKSLDSVISFNELSASFINEGIMLNKELKTGELMLIYNSFKRINDIDDELYLKEYCTECVVFYVMYLALQKEQRVDSLQKSRYYYNNFKIELEKIAQIYEGYSESKKIRTKYLKV
ncbi:MULTISPECIES: hypothetical protein [unclassified Campylobacter]|uniref:hypothetical protein n=1 Tax=unclassified Campylobacter TaxID=2593542 RepID=UPI003D34F142